MSSLYLFSLALPLAAATAYFDQCPDPATHQSPSTIGVCKQDFALLGGELEPVYEATVAPTGIALDLDQNIYISRHRNLANEENTLAIVTSFTTEEPWPSAEVQKPWTEGVNATEALINVQNIILASDGLLWVCDSGIPYNQTWPLTGGAKIIAYNGTTREKVATYALPDYPDLTVTDDVRVNATTGFAYVGDQSESGSIIVVNLATGASVKRLFNTTETRPNRKYVGSYNGEPVYCWRGTTKKFCNTGANGMALLNDQLYWAPLASRRFYYLSQQVLNDFSLTDAQVLAAVQDPGELGSETAGLTADDQGRLYITAGEQNAIYYVQTEQDRVEVEVNGVGPGGSGPVHPDNYWVKSLVRNALIQHADTMAVFQGYLYFTTNQLAYGVSRQYQNQDNRKGPFRSYRIKVDAEASEFKGLSPK